MSLGPEDHQICLRFIIPGEIKYFHWLQEYAPTRSSTFTSCVLAIKVIIQRQTISTRLRGCHMWNVSAPCSRIMRDQVKSSWVHTVVLIES